VRRRLADSFAQLQDAIDRSEAEPAFAHCIELLDAGRVRPGMFAAYSDLVEAIAAQDDEKFRDAMQALGQSEAAGWDIRALTLDDRQLGPGMAERFVRHIDSDPTQPLALAPLPAGELPAVQRRLDDTLGLLDQGAPELAGEIRGLAREVIVVTSHPRTGEIALESASTFYLWGALFINPAAFPDRVALAEALTHECAHCLLHAFTAAEPLVENAPGERFPSPLRRDARPMEGVVHATYVLARMHYCVERLLASGLLEEAERTRAAAVRAEHARGFADGLATVDRHARFNARGAAIFAAARDYMRGRVAA
jgi:HEXXH motif-containing protein